MDVIYPSLLEVAAGIVTVVPLRAYDELNAASCTTVFHAFAVASAVPTEPLPAVGVGSFFLVTVISPFSFCVICSTYCPSQEPVDVPALGFTAFCFDLNALVNAVSSANLDATTESAIAFIFPVVPSAITKVSSINGLSPLNKAFATSVVPNFCHLDGSAVEPILSIATHSELSAELTQTSPFFTLVNSLIAASELLTPSKCIIVPRAVIKLSAYAAASS